MANPNPTESHRSVTRPNLIRSQIPVLGPYKSQKVYLLRKAKGIPSMVDAEPIVKHIQWLHSIGFNNESIGAAAGLPPATLWGFQNYGYKRIHIDRASRIMAVTHIPVPEQAGIIVPNIGTKRRIDALRAIGYSCATLGEHLGVTGEAVSQYRGRPVRGRTWTAIRDLYNQLSHIPGPNPVAAIRARRLGCQPPMAWEGIDIDHPDSCPDPGANSTRQGVDEIMVARILAGDYRGRVPRAERNAVVDHVLTRHPDRAPSIIAKLLHQTPDAAAQTVLRRRRELRSQKPS